MKLSKEIREELCSQLLPTWGAVHLMCDGYKVTLSVQRSGKSLQYRVMTYVNGYFKGEWMSATTPHPEQKFLRKSVRPFVSATEKAKLEKAFGKRYVKNDPYCNGSVTIYMPDWASGKAAISHLCKVCDSIEVLESQP